MARSRVEHNVEPFEEGGKPAAFGATSPRCCDRGEAQFRPAPAGFAACGSASPSGRGPGSRA